MKRKIVALLFTGIMSVSLLTGCGEKAEVEYLQQQIVELSAEKAQLESSVAELREMETAEKIRTGTETYVVKINIKQTHFTLDLDQHLKDAMNDVDITVPVSKEFYDSVSVGTVLDDSFRMGSFIWKGSIGNWKITVSDKYIQ